MIKQYEMNTNFAEMPCMEHPNNIDLYFLLVYHYTTRALST